MGPVSKFRYIEAELIVAMVKEADFAVALTVAHNTKKPSVIEAVRKRIMTLFFGNSPMTDSLKLFISHQKQFESAVKYVAIETNELGLVNARPFIDCTFENLFMRIFEAVKVQHSKFPRTLNDYYFKIRLCRRVSRYLVNLNIIFNRTLQQTVKLPVLISPLPIYLGKDIVFFINSARQPVVQYKWHQEYKYLKLTKERVEFPNNWNNSDWNIIKIFCEIFRLYSGKWIFVEIDNPYQESLHSIGLISSYNKKSPIREIGILVSDLKKFFNINKATHFKDPLIQNWDPEIFKFIDEREKKFN